ncbi:MAG TPA: substrate-binding domain-containing protein, partial [Phototrophicaceae bacterium]|nr:substrate-binding domain-containing protein [Phototrophicaceae bacterium]
EDQEKETAYTEIMLRQRVDGVIMVPTGLNPANVRQILEKNIPVVLIDRDIPDVQTNKVLVGNFQGAHDGMSHLLDLGHRHIGIIGSQEYSPAMQDRLAGIHQALTDRQITRKPDYLIKGSLQQFDIGFQAAQEILRHQPRPTAIFALTDVMAIGVIHAIAEAGLRIPHDISVIGFDDIPLAAFSVPTLTTVAQPIYQMGEIATRLLLKHIQQPGIPPETILLDTRLQVRQSTAPPPA